MPKFSIEEHEKRMRDILAKKGQTGQRPNVLQNLLARAKMKTKPVEGKEKV